MFHRKRSALQTAYIFIAFSLSICDTNFKSQFSNKPLKRLEDEYVLPRIIPWTELEERFLKDVKSPRNPFVDTKTVTSAPIVPALPPPLPPVLPPQSPTPATFFPPVIPSPPSYEEPDPYPSPPSFQQYHNRGKVCVVNIEGKQLSCYQKTKLYRIKLEELKKEAIRTSTNYLLYDGSFNSCHQIHRRKRLIEISMQPSNVHNFTVPFSEIENQNINHNGLDTAEDKPNSYTTFETNGNEHITGHCITSSYTLLKPYYLYNTNNELRFVVQDDDQQVNQCQPKAVCSLTPESYLHLQRNCDPKEVGTRFHCERKTCSHQLLVWDPNDSQRGPFIDLFDFDCCCRCRMETLYPGPCFALNKANAYLNKL